SGWRIWRRNSRRCNRRRLKPSWPERIRLLGDGAVLSESLFNSLAAAFPDFVGGHRVIHQPESHMAAERARIDIFPDEVLLARVRIKLELRRGVGRGHASYRSAILGELVKAACRQFNTLVTAGDHRSRLRT